MRNFLCKTCWVDGITFLESYPNLQFVETWKFGSLYQCSKCGCYWFRYEHKKALSRINDNLLPLSRYWNQNRLTLSDSLWHDLLTIGGTSYDYQERITIPCAVENSTGQYHERAIVIISKQPPYAWYDPQTVHWITEIVKISPSPLALPFSVRQVSAQREEVSMGFAPVGITDNVGQEYILGHRADFLRIKDVKGPSISLSDYQWHNSLLDEICDCIPLAWLAVTVARKSIDLLTKSPKRPPIVWPMPAEAFYFVDWFDGCEAVISQEKTG